MRVCPNTRGDGSEDNTGLVTVAGGDCHEGPRLVVGQEVVEGKARHEAALAVLLRHEDRGPANAAAAVGINPPVDAV